MARIPRFLSSRRLTAPTTGARFSPALASQSGSAAIQVEAQRKAESARKGNIISKTLGSVAAVFQQSQEEQASLTRKKYLIDNTTALQKDAFVAYNQAKQQFPDGIGLTESVGSFFEQRAQQVLAQAPDQKTGLIMAEKMGQLGFQYFKQAFQEGRQLTQASTFNSINGGINESINQAFLDPGSFETQRAQINEFSDNLVTSGVDPTKVGTLQAQKLRDLSKSTLRGLIQRDPQEALDVIVSGQHSDVLQGNDLFGLIGAAQSGITKQQKRLLQDIDDNVVVSVGDGIESGQITYDGQNKLHRNALDTKFNKQLASLAGVEQLGESKNSADLVSSMLPSIGESEDVFKLATEFISLHKGVPTGLKSVIGSNITNGSPERKALASRILNDLYKDDKTRATIADTFSPDTIETALEMNENLMAGYDNEKAAELTTSISLPINDQTTKARTSVITGSDSFKSEQAVSEISDILDVDEDAMNIELPVAEYKKALKDNYVKTGNIDRAQAAAIRQVKDKFQTTNINGESEVHQRVPAQFRDNRFKFNYGMFITQLNKDRGVPDEDPNTDLNNFRRAPIVAQPKFEDTLPIEPEKFEGRRMPKLFHNGTFINPRIQIDERTTRDNSVGMYTFNEFGFKEPILNEDGTELRFRYNPGKTNTELAMEKKISSLSKEREELNNTFKRDNIINKELAESEIGPNPGTVEGKSVIERLNKIFGELF